MLARLLCRGALIALAIAALAKSGRAGNIATDGKLVVTGIVVVSAAVAAGVSVVVVHRRRSKSAITGCVVSGPNGMRVTDETSKRRYALSADSISIQPGDRMTLEGRKRKQSGAFVFEVHGIARDFGACPR